MSTSTDNAEPSQSKSRVPWYRNPNWLLLIIIIALGFWLSHLFTEKEVTVQPAVSSQEAPARVYRKPTSAARIVQHKHTDAGAGIASPTDLTGTLASRPKVGERWPRFFEQGIGLR